jgi:ADP-ribosylglycohydrolase
MDYMEMQVKKAFTFAASDVPEHEAIELIGGGWVGEEALAIALYCASKYFDNFEDAMIAAVNHAGDSDSTGAITGNILGAAIGYEALPEFYKKDLELHDVILTIADDLYIGKVK